MSEQGSHSQQNRREEVHTGSLEFVNGFTVVVGRLGGVPGLLDALGCPGLAVLSSHTSHGLMTETWAASQGAVSRDATMKPREAAIAAM